MKPGSHRFITALILFAFLFPKANAAEDPYLEQTIKASNGKVFTANFCPCGNQIISGSEDRLIKKWDINSYRALQEYSGHFGNIQAIVFSPDTSYFVSSGHNALRLYRPEGDYINTYRGHSTAIWSVVFHPGGRYLITSSFETAPRLWDITTGRFIHLFEGHDRSAMALAISPCGNFLYTGSLDESIRVWDFESRETIAVINNAHHGNIYDLKVSPCGNVLASASEDNTVKLWDLSSLELIAVLEGHAGSIFSVAFSPDGNYLVTGSVDQNIKIWDLNNFNNLHTFTGHTDIVSSVEFSPDGKKLLTGSYDGTVRLWNISPRLFAIFYFPDEIRTEMDESGLFADRERGESRSDFRDRQSKAGEFLERLYLKYYQLYIGMLEKGIMP